MASIRYLNQSAPFWDFIAGLEQQFGRPGEDNEHSGPPPHHHHRGGPPPPHRGNWHRGPMPHHPPHHHPWGPPPPHHGGPHHSPDHRGPPPPPPPHGDHDGEEDGHRPPPDYEASPDTLMGDAEKSSPASKQAADKQPTATAEEEEAANTSTPESGNEGPSHRRRHCGRPGGGRGAHHHPGPEGPHHGHHRGRSHSHGRGRRGGPGGPRGHWGRGPRHGWNAEHHQPGGPGPFGAPFALPPFAERWMDFIAGEWAQVQGQGFGFPGTERAGPAAAAATGAERQTTGAGEQASSTERDFPSFTPEADVFDTPAAYVLHLPLPGAKKEDISVTWDSELSELCVGGVIFRAGSEELLATLALDERQVGAFERKVRLGSRANPAVVREEEISARLEDGVLFVEVPKGEEFVEVRKVDVE